MEKLFKVAAVSSNTNAFGLYSVIMIARDGQAYQVYTNMYNKPEQGQILKAGMNKSDKLAHVISMNYEVPTELDRAPAKVAKEVWR